ncbi:DUF4352 domain-containing protein [Desulfosporosinus sp. Sb-LF]|uniref:DUF4352 domain-containing protein n=1 Tax=Desulfosporosinus sp. Sb-LF TaxID=2560027 RepID=UPI00107F7812|nr:DUF4352 domain-containing protein [Desulfosporosinus sp. Sb-LF]TGE30996.1 DUF4352 domain-containing protein [Desulfosporosinus sp. Sb-LF]
MLEFVDTPKVGRQRRYCSQIEYSLLVLLIPMMLFLLGAGALATKAHTNSPQYQMLQTSTIIQQETYVIGETFKMGNLQYRINSVRTSDGEGNVVTPPREGSTFLLVDLTIENQGSTDAEVRSMIGFKLKDKDGKKQNFNREVTLAVKDAIDGTIKAGGTMTGELGYEVVKGAQTFELAIISDPLSSKTKIANVKIPMQ